MKDGSEQELVGKGDLPVEIEELSRAVIGCAIEVHRHLGPGLLERLYEEALIYELRASGMEVRSQVDIVVRYKQLELRGQRLDLLVNGTIIVEIKSIATLLDVHAAVLLSYLRSLDVPVGLLINFNVIQLRQGLKRVFNGRAPMVRPLPGISAPSPSPVSSSSPSLSSPPSS